MTHRIPRYATGLLYLSAALAPLELLGALPMLRLPVAAISLAAMCTLAVLEVLRGSRPRVPFDLVWPAVGMLLSLPLLMKHDGAMALRLCMAVPLFLATLHVAATRAIVVNALWCFCLSSGVLALAELLFMTHPDFLQACLPRALAPSTGVASFFSGTVHGAVGQAILAFALCMALLTARELPGRRRWWLVPAALSMAVWLALVLPPHWTTPPSLGLLGLPRTTVGLAFLLLPLWLTARVLGRFVVSRIEDSTGAQCPLLLVLVLGILVFLVLEPPITLSLALLYALVAAYARPLRTQTPRLEVPRWVMRGGVLGLALLVLLNIAFYAPWNQTSQLERQESRLRSLQAERDREGLRQMLRVVETHNAAAAHFWRAEDHLRQGAPMAAATEFARSLDPAMNTNPLTIFGASRIDGFLDGLRDSCSAVPLSRRGLAYERALLARGEADLALASLKLFATDKPRPAPQVMPMAEALADLLGRKALRHDLADMGGPTLLGIFEGLGATILHGAPPGSAAVFTARGDTSGLVAKHFRMAGHLGGHHVLDDIPDLADWRLADNAVELLDSAGMPIATFPTMSGAGPVFSASPHPTGHTAVLLLAVLLP